MTPAWTSGESSGRATAIRTAARARSPSSRRCSRESRGERPRRRRLPDARYCASDPTPARRFADDRTVTSAHPERGLDQPRAARSIRRGERIHVVGAAGAGASAAALHARWSGAATDGCDPGGPSPYTAALVEAGIQLAWAHDPAHVRRSPRPERLAVTKALTAIDPDHPELRAARAAGIRIEPWQQVIADAATGRLLIGVAGTHGKSTSAGWLVHVLAAAGLDPAAFVGALLPATLTGGVPATARHGSGEAFVVEADEYAGNFDAYRPAVAILTSAEWDHPDVFRDRAAVVAAFDRWVRAMAGVRDAP